MKHSEYKKQLEQDAEYQVVKKELKPLIDLSNQILRLRLQKGWSQQELAKRAGTRQANISKLESGQGNPTYRLLKKISDAFGEDLHIGMGEPETNQPQTITRILPVVVEAPTKKQYYNTSQISESSPFRTERIP